MGMTIENCIKELLINKEDDTYVLGNALDFAIETMRKYQKIAKIIRDYDVTWEFHFMKPTIDKIREVLEDGNDN